MRLTLEEKSDILQIYIKNNYNAISSRREYSLSFPNRRLPAANTFKNIFDLFQEKKSLYVRKQTQRPNEDDELTILLHFEENQETSVRSASRYLNISVGKIHKILKKHNRKPYKFLPVTKLTEDHILARRVFCEIMLNCLNQNHNFFNRIMWTDECTFSTAGVYNRKNTHIWSDENPRAIREIKFQGRKSVSVWCGILNNRIYGPIYFQKLTGATYLQMLQIQIEALLEELPLQFYNDMVWHQDGAPVHNVVEVQNYLNMRFNEWIGARGPIRWPANSPDLSLLDTFLWGDLKNHCYEYPNGSIEELQGKIAERIRFLNNNPDIILASINNLKKRYRLCLQMNGLQFEQFL